MKITNGASPFCINSIQNKKCVNNVLFYGESISTMECFYLYNKLFKKSLQKKCFFCAFKFLIGNRGANGCI